MTNGLTAQSLSNRAAFLHKLAARLRETARHDSMTNQVDRAILDITEAETWLERQKIGAQPGNLNLASAALLLAQHRLDRINSHLATYGPDAMLVE